MCGKSPWLHPIAEYLCASSDVGLLSPPHDSSSTCYRIKAHCPFLSFEKTSLSTWLMSTVTASIPLIRYSYFTSGRYNCARLSSCCDSVKLWTTTDMLLSRVDCVGGLWCNLLPQRKPTKVQEMTPVLPLSSLTLQWPAYLTRNFLLPCNYSPLS